MSRVGAAEALLLRSFIEDKIARYERSFSDLSRVQNALDVFIDNLFAAGKFKEQTIITRYVRDAQGRITGTEQKTDVRGPVNLALDNRNKLVYEDFKTFIKDEKSYADVYYLSGLISVSALELAGREVNTDLHEEFSKALLSHDPKPIQDAFQEFLDPGGVESLKSLAYKNVRHIPAIREQQVFKDVEYTIPKELFNQAHWGWTKQEIESKQDSI